MDLLVHQVLGHVVRLKAPVTATGSAHGSPLMQPASMRSPASVAFERLGCTVAEAVIFGGIPRPSGRERTNAAETIAQVTRVGDSVPPGALAHVHWYVHRIRVKVDPPHLDIKNSAIIHA